MGGSTPKRSASVTATAAPVGVVSSTAGPARVNRRVYQQQRRGRRGNRQNAVLGLDRAAAHVQRRADDGVDVQQVERQAGAHDIGDRIGRAHFVEMDFLDGHLVHCGLGFAQPAEHGDGVAPGAARKLGLFDHLDDVREVPVDVRVSHRDVELGGADAAALHLFETITVAPASSEAMAAAMASGSAPASASAPTSMSPLIPENASR